MDSIDGSSNCTRVGSSNLIMPSMGKVKPGRSELKETSEVKFMGKKSCPKNGVLDELEDVVSHAAKNGMLSPGHVEKTLESGLARDGGDAVTIIAHIRGSCWRCG